MAGAEVVEGDAAAGMTQRLDKSRRFLEIAKCRCFGDLDHEAARQLWPVV